MGDEYMAADHAEAIAELALRIRDHMAATEFAGKRISLRIGIHSGPVVAGIIGRHKFAYRERVYFGPPFPAPEWRAQWVEREDPAVD